MILKYPIPSIGYYAGTRLYKHININKRDKKELGDKLIEINKVYLINIIKLLKLCRDLNNYIIVFYYYFKNKVLKK